MRQCPLFAVESCTDSTSHNPPATPSSHTQGQTPSASAGLPSQRGAIAGPSSVGSSGSRHRRLGHSGPPTGNFQLVLNPQHQDDSEEEEEEEEDRESLPSRSLPFWSYGCATQLSCPCADRQMGWGGGGSDVYVYDWGWVGFT